MDRFQMNKSTYINRPNQAGFVDLTLRLGLPNYNANNSDEILTQIGQALNSEVKINPNNHQQASPINYFDGSHFGTSTRDDQWRGNINNNANNSSGGQINYLGRINQTGILEQINGSSTGPDISSAACYGTNPYRNAFPPAPQMDCVLLNPSSTSTTTAGLTGRRAQAKAQAQGQTQTQAQHLKGSTGGASRRNKKKGVPVAEDEPDKRCSNYNCGANSTPMWRKGPLGPKSLCNACGIKYRKQEEKKAAEKAAAYSCSTSSTLKD